VIRHRVSIAGCGTGGCGKVATSVVLLLVVLSLRPEVVAAQGRLAARATVISAAAAREGLALSDSVGRVGLQADTLAMVRRVDGVITTGFWYRPRPSISEPDAIVGRRPAGTPRPAPARVARVLEIHYLRN